MCGKSLELLDSCQLKEFKHFACLKQPRRGSQDELFGVFLVAHPRVHQHACDAIFNELLKRSALFIKLSLRASFQLLDLSRNDSVFVWLDVVDPI